MVNKLRRGEELEADELRRMRGELERCAETTRRLADACDRLQSCFGAQISLSLFSATLYYITFVYQGLHYLITQKVLGDTTIWNFLLTLTVLVSIKIMVMLAGQRVRNEAGILDTKLAELRNLLVTLPGHEAAGCAGVGRALARRLRAAPLRAALLLDVLAVVLNHTVILLQFNHVV